MLKIYFSALVALINCTAFCGTLLCAEQEGPVIDGNTLRSWPRTYSGRAVIPKGIQYIDDGAFSGCRNVTSVVLPQGILAIGNFAFSQCHGLTEIVVPATVTNIGVRAFFFCGNLTNAVVNAAVESIPRGMYERCILLKRTILPQTLGKIEEDAFRGCRSLRAMTIPAGVTNISQMAFAMCSNLESVEIPNGLRSMGDRAFAWCYNLGKVKGVEAVGELGKDTFLENGLYHGKVGIPGLANVVRLAAEGISLEGPDCGVDLLAMDRMAAHADEIRIGMSHEDVEDVIRRLQFGFGHGAEKTDNGSMVHTSTIIRFGLSRNGNVGLWLKYKHDSVCDIALTEAFKLGAMTGARGSNFKIGEAEQRWL